MRRRRGAQTTRPASGPPRRREAVDSSAGGLREDRERPDFRHRQRLPRHSTRIPDDQMRRLCSTASAEPAPNQSRTMTRPQGGQLWDLRFPCNTDGPCAPQRQPILRAPGYLYRRHSVRAARESTEGHSESVITLRSKYTTQSGLRRACKGIDATTLAGKLLMYILGAIAEFKRALTLASPADLPMRAGPTPGRSSGTRRSPRRPRASSARTPPTASATRHSAGRRA